MPRGPTSSAIDAITNVKRDSSPILGLRSSPSEPQCPPRMIDFFFGSAFASW